MPNLPTAPLPFADLQQALSHVEPSQWLRLQGRRVFISGGTGFVGKWMLATLLEANRSFELDCEIVILTRDPAAFEARTPDLARARIVHLLKGDVRDFDFPTGNVDVVIHAATDVATASTPLATFDTCLGGTRRMLDFAVQTHATDFLLVSSGAVYGRQPPDVPALVETYAGAPDTLAPASAYGQGKRVSEWLTSVYAAEHGLRTVTARLFAFVGPYLPLDKQFAIGNFLSDALAGRPIVIRGDGTPLRGYLHASDMAGWLWSILFSGTPGAAYNVGCNEAISIAELARKVMTLLESQEPFTTRRTPAPGTSAERYIPDTWKARTELCPNVVLSLDEAIRRTAAWHRL